MDAMKNVLKNAWAILFVGFVLGILSFIALRFITYESGNVHYHANFALYIDGERDEFDSFTFYEEVQACVADGTDNPKARVHMHDQVNDVVHVHANSVTWGHFFANLGYTLGDKVLVTGSGLHTDEAIGNELTFVLNGTKVTSVANRVIENEDRLLINYGNDSDGTLEERFGMIAPNAHEYNDRHDPGGCAGDEALTFTERLKRAIGIGGSTVKSSDAHPHSH
jgi:hypothetical protein